MFLCPFPEEGVIAIPLTIQGEQFRWWMDPFLQAVVQLMKKVHSGKNQESDH